MNTVPCMKQVRSPVLWFCGDLIQLMAGILSGVYTDLSMDSLVAQKIKCLPTMWKTGLGRCPGEGNGNPLQYSCLKNLLGQRSLAGYSP